MVNYQRRIPDKLDICSVLQETLDNGSDLPDKLDNYSNTITTAPVPITLHESSINCKSGSQHIPSNGRTLNGSEKLQHKRDSKHKISEEDTTNADARNTHSEITVTKLSTHASVIDVHGNLDTRRHSNIRASLQHANTDSSAILERLSPTSITVDTVHVDESADNGDINNILVDNGKLSQTSEEIKHCGNNIDNDGRVPGKVATFTQSEFIFPRLI